VLTQARMRGLSKGISPEIIGSMRILRSWLLLGPDPVLPFDYFIA